MNRTQIATCNALWTAGNNAGNGYTPDYEGADVEEVVAAMVADGYTVEHQACDSVTVLSRDGEYVGVGDAHGAWAVELEVRREVAPNVDNDDFVAAARAAYAEDIGLALWQTEAAYGDDGQREVIVCTADGF